MHYKEEFSLWMCPAPDPFDLVRAVLAEIGVDAEIEPWGDGPGQHQTAWIIGEELSVSAFINLSRGTDVEPVFEAVSGKNAGQWLDFNLVVFGVEHFDDLAPTVIKAIGAALRNSKGGAILFDGVTNYPGLVRRGGQVYLNTPYWGWTQAEEALLSVPHEFQCLPMRYDSGPGISSEVATPGDLLVSHLSSPLGDALGAPLLHAGYWHWRVLDDLGRL